MWKSIKKALGWVWGFIRPTVSQLLTETGKIVAGVAREVVVEAATAAVAGNLNGKDISTYARDRMKEVLLSKGVEVGVNASMSLINTALELALQEAKEKGDVE